MATKKMLFEVEEGEPLCWDCPFQNMEESPFCKDCSKLKLDYSTLKMIGELPDEQYDDILNAVSNFYRNIEHTFIKLLNKKYRENYEEYKRTIRGCFDPKIGWIVRVESICTNYITAIWEEHWQYGGFDTGEVQIPFDWFKKEEDANKKEKDEIKNKIKEMVAERLEKSIDNIHLYDLLFKGLGFDNLDFVELIVAIERDFDINIEDEEIDNKDYSIMDIVNLVLNKLNIK